VALSGNADILGIFGKLGKLLGIGRIGVNLAVVASAILFKFEAIISFAQLMILICYTFEQHSFHL
jgi:hypothetical protein